jgi:hypothetical protein
VNIALLSEIGIFYSVDHKTRSSNYAHLKVAGGALMKEFTKQKLSAKRSKVISSHV